MGVQCGGWSVGWRGRRGNITPGTTVRQGLAEVLGAGRVDFSKDAAGADKADVVIAVVGEDPYAESSGDRQKLELLPDDRALVAAAKRAGKPLVVVVLSGRPLIIPEVFEAADAVVAAWLPGTEGAGVADLLAGAVKPTGKLSFSWPKDMAQIPINVGDPAYAPLFPVGFGLSW
jgi:beta-glucosidase